MSACSHRPDIIAGEYPTYDPFVRGDAPAESSGAQEGDSTTSRPRGPTPTLAPLSVTLPAVAAGSLLVTPTPDLPRSLPTPRQLADEYVVQPGDTVGAIAQSFGVGIQDLLDANNLSEEDLLALGTTLRIPRPDPGAPGSSFKIIPDSELVLGPASADFDTAAFVLSQGGYLASYTEVLDIDVLTGADIVDRVSRNYSVNPRLLLAILEHRSRWVTERDPQLANPDFPLGFVHPNRLGLYRQLAWAANELNRGYYLWRANAVGTWVLNDGSVVPIDPTINAGTAAVQQFFAELGDRPTWDIDVAPFGLWQTYFFMFENPFSRAVEPVLPSSVFQPRLQLPFEDAVEWAFTGGPHGAWDSGSGWGALDFAPPDVLGCAVSEHWVVAAADGYVVRAENGAVVQDLDGDGYEQTGWDILYMHLFEQDRVEAGTYVFAGDRIGHPSCEGGISNAAHLHMARKYNGEWVPADGSIPFQLDAWVSAGQGSEYDGFLRDGLVTLEADEGVSSSNLISR